MLSFEFVNQSEEPMVVSIEPYGDEFTLAPRYACKFSYFGEIYPETEHHQWTVSHTKDCIAVFAPGPGMPQVKLGRPVLGKHKFEYDDAFLFEDRVPAENQT